MKILVADSVSERAVEILREQESWDVVFLPKKTGANVAEEIQDADALIVRSATKVTSQLLAKAERLRVIGRAGTGVDNVDLDAATQKGVVVMNTPGGNAVSVAEHTLALLLSLARRIPQADALMKQGKWEKKKLEGMELRGKTLGLIGLGQIGSDVARLAKAFQMEIIAYDPYVSSLLAGELDVKLGSIEDVFKSADFISLHCSATPETRHLVNARTLALAQPGLRIVNCARGELINEADLLSALECGLVAGAGLDVFETEPPKDSKLVSHPSVIATPHIAGSTEEAQEIVGIRIAEQVRDFLISGVARSAVNMPAVSPDEFKKLEPYIQLGEKLGAFLAQTCGGKNPSSAHQLRRRTGGAEHSPGEERGAEGNPDARALRAGEPD
jgi:D-3-phosphoglycerate dehydrogenase